MATCFRLRAFFFTALFYCPIAAQEYFHRIYNLETGFPNAQVWDIAQDARGYLWFATGGGIVRYSGQSYTIMGKDDGFVGNVARSILYDRDGRMWITFDEGVSSWDGQTIVNYTTEQGLPHGIIRKAAVDRLGRLWFVSSDDGAAVLENGRVARVEVDTVSKSLRSVVVDSSGHVWIGGKHGLSVLLWRDGHYDSTIIHLGGSKLRLPGYIVELAQMPDGRMVIATQGGMAVFDSKLWLSRVGQDANAFLRVYTVADGLPHSYVSDIASDGSDLWVATDLGLARFDGLRFHNTLFDESKTTNGLSAVFIDRSGILWIGTDGAGVIKVPSRKVLRFNSREGLLSNIVNALETGDDGSVYVATDNGINIIKNGRVEKLADHGMFEGNAVWSLRRLSNGRFWIGSERGLHELASGRLTSLNSVYRLSDATITDIEEDAAGRVWVASTNGLSVVDGSQQYHFTKEHGLPSNQVWCILHSESLGVWMATSGGLARWQGRNFENIKFDSWSVQNGLPDNYANVLEEYPEGTLWIGTDAGLCRFQNGTFENYSLKNLHLLRDNRVTVLKYDSLRKGLWVGSSGFVLLDVDSFPFSTLDIWTNRNGLIGDETTTHNSLLLERDGTSWVGSYSGLTYIKEPIRAVLPSVHIESIRTIDSMYVNAATEVEINGRYVEFSFSCPFYTDEDGLYFRYWLEGFDGNWSSPSRSTSVRYTNLTPGSYVFRVQPWMPTTSPGVETQIHLTVPLPWWQHGYVLLLIMAITGAAAYRTARFLVRRRTRKIEEHNRELELVVQQRTAEILHQKQHLEAVLEELKKTQSQLIQSEKMAALGQLVAGVAHEINNPTSILAGNVSYVEDYVNGLRKLLSLYESRADAASRTAAEDLKHSLDYEFMVKDVDGLLSSFRHAAERIRDIVRDLRNFSRPDELDASEVDIHDCLDTTIKLFMNQYRYLLAIECDFQARGRIICAANQINQVFLNLLVNSAHAILSKLPSGSREGVIRISTRNHSDDSILITFWDNGPGIPENILGKIFDPFFTTKPVGQGTGLGLSISYGIVEKHNGTITCRAQEGEWTEFSIVLPVNGMKIS